MRSKRGARDQELRRRRICKKGDNYEKDLQDRCGLRELREQDGAGGEEDRGRQGRDRQFHGAEDEGGVRGWRRACRSDAGSAQELQDRRG